MRRSRVLSFGAVVLALSFAPMAEAGRIVLANDEWTLSDFGPAFTAPNDAGTFALNVRTWFTGSSGDILAFSNNFGLTGASLAAVMTSGGNHTWTVDTSAASWSNLSTYDAVFLGGFQVPNVSDLIAYVNGGGNVYLMAGTGGCCFTSAAAEAAYWNTFLNAFGLAYGPSYNLVGGNIPISSSHPIFAGVDSLYQDNGNDTLDILPLDPNGVVLVTNAAGHGLYAVFESAAVPEPGTVILVGAGLAALGLRRRRRA